MANCKCGREIGTKKPHVINPDGSVTCGRCVCMAWDSRYAQRHQPEQRRDWFGFSAAGYETGDYHHDMLRDV